MKRPKIARTVRCRTTHELKPRILSLTMQSQIEVFLIIAQFDVELRLVLLDQIVFKDNRFFLSPCNEGLQIANQTRQRRNKSACIGAALLEITTNTCA